MKKIRFLYYMARKDGKVMDDIIGRSTHRHNEDAMRACGFDPSDVPMLAHCEVEIEPSYGIFNRVCYTSTMGQMRNHGILRNLFSKGDGTVCRPSEEVLKNPERWLYIDIFVDDDTFRVIEDWLNTEVANNKGYDILCILSFLFPRRFHSSKKNICSEVDHRVAVIAGEREQHPWLVCYYTRFEDTWRDVPSPLLQMLNMVCCGYRLRRCVDDSIVLEK